MVGFDILRNEALIRDHSILSKVLSLFSAISLSSLLINPLKIIYNLQTKYFINCYQSKFYQILQYQIIVKKINKYYIYYFLNISKRKHKKIMIRNFKNQYRYDQNEIYHKDHIISNLKKQLFQIKDIQHDFIRLNDQVSSLQSKYALMIDEKQRLENQHKLKIQISKKNLNELRNDIDNLKMQIHKINVQIDDTIRQNTTLKRMCDNRQTQIASLMASNRQVQKNNDIHIEQNRNLTYTLKNLKEQRNRAEEQCDRLNKLLDDSMSTLKQLQKQIKQLEASNVKLDSILAQAEKDHINLLEELKNKETEVENANKNLKEITQQTEDLRQTSNKLQKQCQKSQQEYKELCDKLEQSCTKNKQFVQRFQTLENTLRATQTDLDNAMIKRQSLKKQHIDLAGENKTLNSQIDQCLLTILEYEKVNKNLQKEVENYIACDEEVRSMLNRKQAMRGLLQEITVKLSKTEEQIAHLR